MSFLSGGFFLLLAGLIPVYYLLPKRGRYLALLAGSLLFYGLAGRGYLPFLLLTATSTYAAARWLGNSMEKEKAYLSAHRKDMPKEARDRYKQAGHRRRSLVFLLCLGLNLGLLAALKYAGWLLDTLGAPWQIDWVLPLGISFYTFQSLGYLIDVKRGKYLPETNYLRFLLFVSFFPQLIQGPISRYDMLADTLYEGADFSAVGMGQGLVRMLWGYAKKLLVADRLAPLLGIILSQPGHEGGWVLAGMVLYALRLYADFTGGIDIALGVGRLFGVTLPENFNRPYLSKNIEEYWTRWHITMGSWFRDYIFYPLNVSKPFLRWMKKLRNRFGNKLPSRLPLFSATLLVWLATGVWHGAGWNFALWGLTNGVVILLSLLCKPLYERFSRRFPRLKGSRAYGIFEIGRTFLLMCLIRLWDCYAGPRAVWQAFSSLFRVFNYGAVVVALPSLGLLPGEWAVVLIMSACMLWVSLKKGEGSFTEQYLTSTPRLCFVAAGLLVAILLLGAYGPGYAAADFIYGQF